MGVFLIVRQERLSYAKRTRLINAAIEEFAERGVDSASYNKIIERSGLSKGTVYYYFDNKDSLLMTVLDEICDQFHQAIGDIKLPETREEFWDTVREYDGRAIRFFLGNPRLWRVLHWISKDLPLKEQFKVIRERITYFIDNLTAKGLEIGAVRNDIPLETAQRLRHEMGKVLAYEMLGDFEAWSKGKCEKELLDVEKFIAAMHDLGKRILTPREDWVCTHFCKN